MTAVLLAVLLAAAIWLSRRKPAPAPPAPVPTPVPAGTALQILSVGGRDMEDGTNSLRIGVDGTLGDDWVGRAARLTGVGAEFEGFIFIVGAVRPAYPPMYGNPGTPPMLVGVPAKLPAAPEKIGRGTVTLLA